MSSNNVKTYQDRRFVISTQDTQVRKLNLGSRNSFDRSLIILLTTTPQFNRCITCTRHKLTRSPYEACYQNQVTFPTFRAHRLQQDTSSSFRHITTLLHVTHRIRFHQDTTITIVNRNFTIRTRFMVNQDPSRVRRCLPINPYRQCNRLNQRGIIFLHPIHRANRMANITHENYNHFLHHKMNSRFTTQRLTTMNQGVLLHHRHTTQRRYCSQGGAPRVFTFLAFVFTIQQGRFPHSTPTWQGYSCVYTNGSDGFSKAGSIEASRARFSYRPTTYPPSQ